VFVICGKIILFFCIFVTLCRFSSHFFTIPHTYHQWCKKIAVKQKETKCKYRAAIVLGLARPCVDSSLNLTWQSVVILSWQFCLKWSRLYVTISGLLTLITEPWIVCNMTILISFFGRASDLHLCLYNQLFALFRYVFKFLTL